MLHVDSFIIERPYPTGWGMLDDSISIEHFDH